MAQFSYKAKKGLYQSVEGTIDAASREEAVSKLTESGVFPVSVTQVAPASVLRQKTFDIATLIRRNKRVGSADVLIFSQKLTTMIKARVELLSALKILYDQTDNAGFKRVIQDIYSATKEGRVFSESLGRFPDVFPPLFVNLVKTGEASGRLDIALEQISQFLERDESLRGKVRIALAYPSVLLFVGSGSIFFLINFVIPRLRPLFESAQRELPLITRVILRLSAVSNKIWLSGIIAITAAIFFIHLRTKGNALRKAAVWLKCRLPVIKRLTYNQELVHFCRSFGLLLKSGVPALTALDVAALGISTPQLHAGIRKVSEEVAAGHSISRSMDTFTTFPSFLTKMIAVGEESGRLSEVLEEISRSYTQQVESDIALVTSLVEPLLILVLGSILGVIVLSILLPTFQITQMVR